MNEPVEVRRDQWGVAHIYAKNADDLFFAQGFVAAQDRLFQIDLWRRQGNGELAEIMGPSAVEADTFARQVKYRGDMEAEWQAYSPDTQAIAAAFIRGINACIEQMGDNLPVEFQLLGYKPKRWAPEDILSRSSGIYMSQNFRNEVMRLKLIDLVGIEKARWLAPIDPPRNYEVQLSADDVKHFPEKLLAGYEALTKSLTFTPSTSESNNWVVAASRSLSGKPLLASDPHRAIALPSLRYMVHLHAPGWNVIGAGEPALPGVALGHNERIAWGITIIGADTADIYVEELNPQNANEYSVGDRFAPMKSYEEEIVVKGEAKTRKVTVKHSRHGPIIFEDAKRNRAYALKWIGSDPGGAAYLPALRLARAQNQTEFKDALKHWSVPGLNFVYADVDGNTGWVAATKYPIRGEQHSGLLPVPGKSGLEWSGYLSLDQYPQEFNPKAGHLVTANHNILPQGYVHAIGHEFSPPYRYRRLNELLWTRKKWDIDGFRSLQQDSTSLAAIQLGSKALQWKYDSSERAMGALIRQGDLSVDSPTGSIYALCQRESQTRLFQQHVSAEHVKVLQSLAGTQAANDAIIHADQRWFGDNAQQKANDLLHQSFRAALEKWLQLPPEQQQRWGALHQVTFKHPLTTWSPAAAQLFNIGPFERPGDANSPNNTRYDDNFQQIHGASYRQLFDLADWDRGLATSAPGQSGQFGSPHYNDLAPLWTKGEYFPLVYSRGKVEEVTKHKLVLQPKP